MEKAEYIWHSGKFVPWDEAQVHVLSHGLHYGTGVFEGIRCYDGDKGPAIFRHAEHLQRLRLGQAVEVRLARVDLDERKIDFTLADAGEGRSRRGRRRR